MAGDLNATRIYAASCSVRKTWVCYEIRCSNPMSYLPNNDAMESDGAFELERPGSFFIVCTTIKLLLNLSV